MVRAKVDWNPGSIFLLVHALNHWVVLSPCFKTVQVACYSSMHIIEVSVKTAYSYTCMCGWIRWQIVQDCCQWHGAYISFLKNVYTFETTKKYLTFLNKCLWWMYFRRYCEDCRNYGYKCCPQEGHLLVTQRKISWPLRKNWSGKPLTSDVRG